jgi:hypothetical protein
MIAPVAASSPPFGDKNPVRLSQRHVAGSVKDELDVH